MKQHITREQWLSIDSFDGVRLTYDMDLKLTLGGSFKEFPSIGQMIEFLFDNDYGPVITSNDNAFYWTIEPDKKLECWLEEKYERAELADALWEAVKDVLHHISPKVQSN